MSRPSGQASQADYDPRLDGIASSDDEYPDEGWCPYCGEPPACCDCVDSEWEGVIERERKRARTVLDRSTDDSVEIIPGTQRVEASGISSSESTVAAGPSPVLSGGGVASSKAKDKEKEKAPPKKRFRCRGKNFFLTYPQCKADSVIMKETFEKIFGIDNIVFMRMCFEKHQDGSDHRHALVMLRETFEAKSSTFADLEVKEGDGLSVIYHGNYQVAKSPSRVYHYVSKAGEFVSFGKDPEYMKQRKSTLALAVDEMDQGKAPADIRKLYPTFYFMQKKRVIDYCGEVALMAQSSALLKWDEVGMAQRLLDYIKKRGEADAGSVVLTWLIGNIDSKRRFKQGQLYLHGPPNYGKTSLIRVLSKFAPVYSAPTDEQFFDLYDETFHRLVVFDEFKGQHPVTFMNQFLEMGVMTIRQKGSQMLRKNNIPVVICSNLSPRDAYKNVSDATMDGFRARLTVVELLSPLFPILEEIAACHGFSLADV